MRLDNDGQRTGYLKLKRTLGRGWGDDTPIPYGVIVESNGLDDALWCCRAEPQHAREWRLYAVWCARRVQHLMSDPRSVAALDVADRHARCEASDSELAAAVAAMHDAGAATLAARAAVRATSEAATGNARSAAVAAWFAAGAAAEAAAWAARSAAGADARDAAWADMTAEFLRVVGSQEAPTS